MIDYKYTQEQVQLYFNTVHCFNQKGGRYIYSPQEDFSYTRSATPTGVLYQIKEKYRLNEFGGIFCTLNTYKSKYIDTVQRCDKDLWGIDCVMIDIDGDAEICDYEPVLMDRLKWFWEEKKMLPVPNLYSFTGGGGIHLYYAFHRLPASMSKSVKRLKYTICNVLSDIAKNDNAFPTIYDENGKPHSYHVDFKVNDNQRYDRIPGSLNYKTGRLCQCFATGQPKYEYRELTAFFEDEEPVYQNSNSNKIVSIANISDDIKPANKLMCKRIDSLFKLAKAGKTFEGCREMALFVLFNSVIQLNPNISAAKEVLYKLNSLFESPLSTKEVDNVLKAKKIYKFSNETLIKSLNLTENEQKIMFSAKRPGNRKEKTFNNKVNIAKLVREGLSCSEISKKLKLSVSCVKHMRVEIKKQGGFLYWALSCNKEKVKEYIKKFIKNVHQNNHTTSGSFCNVSNNLCKGIKVITNNIDNIKLKLFSNLHDKHYIELLINNAIGYINKYAINAHITKPLTLYKNKYLLAA